jgi:hypothetical protein
MIDLSNILSDILPTLRDVRAAGLSDRASVMRPPDPATAQRKPSGAILDTYPDYWILVRANAPCKINLPTRRGIERFGAGKTQAISEPTADFEHDQVIDETCRFRVTAAPNNPLLVGEDFDVTNASLESSPIKRTVEISKTTR